MSELTTIPYSAWYRAHLNELAVLSEAECLDAYCLYLSRLAAVKAMVRQYVAVDASRQLNN